MAPSRGPCRAPRVALECETCGSGAGRPGLGEAVRVYETPTGLEFPGVTLLASARREESV